MNRLYATLVTRDIPHKHQTTELSHSIGISYRFSGLLHIIEHTTGYSTQYHSFYMSNTNISHQ
jgi:hypothetical protein